ncbi:MAG: nuclease [Acidobacteriota bacterium]|jgi:hypothetical protein|nr:nuclease [Acidobacteriota bacterium]
MRKVPAILILIALCVPQLFAWGEDGHRTVCRIAYDSLSTAERKEIDRLVKAYHTPPDTRLKIHGFPDACVFPDEARANARTAVKEHITDSPWLHFTPFNDWHFLNVERNVKTLPESACADDCVLTGIATHSAMLKNGGTDQERAEGLIFLGHWVGDVHQPLHISYENDEGGNKIAPITGGFYPVPLKFPLNLHSVWDSGIIRKALTAKGWQTFADGLKKHITTADKKKWLASTTPLQWAQESYDITTQPDVLYCHEEADGCDGFGTGRALTSAYQEEFVPIVDQRLEMAGTRLAQLIRENLKLKH